jgi:hypothetical protein
MSGALEVEDCLKYFAKLHHDGDSSRLALIEAIVYLLETIHTQTQGL